MPLESLSCDLYFWSYAQNIGRRSLMSYSFLTIPMHTCKHTRSLCMEVKALCLKVGDCWYLLNIIVEIVIREFSINSLTLVSLLCCHMFVLLFVVSLTQHKLLNSLITLGTMLSLSVGVRLCSKQSKSFKFFKKKSTNPSGRPTSVRTPEPIL